MSADAAGIGQNLQRGRDAWEQREVSRRQSCDADPRGDRRRTERRIPTSGSRFLDNYPFYNPG